MAQISNYKQSFGLVAKVYKKYRGNYTPELFELLLSLPKKQKGEPLRVLDLGCGVGNSTEPLLKMARHMKIPITVAGCDPDVRMLKEARASAKKRKLPIRYVVGAAEKLPFESGQFDLIISGAAFHWFATKKAMRQIQRVLDERGVYAVFWTQNVPGKNIILGKELYKKYKWKGIPRGLRDPKNVKVVFVGGGFTKVRTLKLPRMERRTMDETVGHAETNSSYAILSAKDKKVFDKELRREYRRVLGNKPDTVYQVVNVCTGARPQ